VWRLCLLIRIHTDAVVDKSIVFLGEKLVVRYMRFGDTFPAEDYLATAPRPICVRTLVIAERLANEGKIHNKQHAHFLEEPFQEIFELKPDGARVFGFFHERNFYLTNGARKKNAKAQQSDYRIAQQMRDDFIKRIDEQKKRKLGL
jgi:hypothetical protein